MKANQTEFSKMLLTPQPPQCSGTEQSLKTEEEITYISCCYKRNAMYEKLTKISEAVTINKIAKTTYSEEEELVVIIKVKM
jgi:hypothetical protein